MIRRLSDLPAEAKANIRGGEGRALDVSLLQLGDMAGVLSLGRLPLEPGASIGEHAHPNTEDLYLIVEGRGTGLLNGERFPVGSGDLFLVKAGGSHGLVNDSEAPLTFIGLLTQSEEKI